MRGGSQRTEQVTMKEVVVATRDLEIGDTIQPGDLRMDGWPSNRIPDGAHLEIEPVISRVPVSRVLAGEPVLERRLSPAGSGAGLSAKVPEGMRAVSVRVDDVNGVSGFVLPEARVDVLVTAVPRDSPDLGNVTKTILGNVRVISAGENLEADASGRPQKVKVVTLLVTPEQAEIVTLGASKGRLQLILRNSSDDAVADSSGIAERELFATRKQPPPNVSNPRPRPVVTRIEMPPPPPPPPIEVEVIRGDQRSVSSFPTGGD
jgi:pilus assembly protein CpaB